MKEITFLLLCFSTIFCFGQDIDYINKLDTVFVKFKKSNFQTKVGSEDYRFYTFMLGETPDDGSIYFTKPDFYDNTHETAKKYLPIIVNKSFLKKHKKDIVGLAFFKKYGVKKSTYEAFSANCVFYLFECEKQKKGNINLYRVQMSSSYRMGE
jgi:hypothetical protein